MKLKQKIGAIAVSTVMATTMGMPVVGSIGTIDYNPITDAISGAVNDGVNSGITMVSAQTDLFSFLVFVGVVSVIVGLIFYFLNKIRGGNNQ